MNIQTLIVLNFIQKIKEGVTAFIQPAVEQLWQSTPLNSNTGPKRISFSLKYSEFSTGREKFNKKENRCCENAVKNDTLMQQIVYINAQHKLVFDICT